MFVVKKIISSVHHEDFVQLKFDIFSLQKKKGLITYKDDIHKTLYSDLLRHTQSMFGQKIISMFII
jgi:hypothetical protein